jgi:hypothetical protein
MTHFNHISHLTYLAAILGHDLANALAELQSKYAELQSKHEATLAELTRTDEQLNLRKALFGKRPQLVLSLDREVINSNSAMIPHKVGLNIPNLSPASSAGGETARQLMMVRQKVCMCVSMYACMCIIRYFVVFLFRCGIWYVSWLAGLVRDRDTALT